MFILFFCKSPAISGRWIKFLACRCDYCIKFAWRRVPSLCCNRDCSPLPFWIIVIMLNHRTIISGICNNLFTCSSWGKMFRLELWGNTRFPTDIDLGEDVMTIPAVIARADRAVCVQQAVYFYRQRAKSLSNGTVNYQRFQKNLYATSVMLDRLCAISPENREQFQKLKLRYDIEGLMYFLRSKPKEAKGKSGLRTMAQGIEDSGSVDVLTPLLKRLVER